VYALSVWLARGGLATHAQYGGDLALYHDDATAITSGQFPYRDLYFEYPPGALVPMLTVAWAHDYAYAFKLLMAALGLAMVLTTGVVLGLLRRSPWRMLVAAVAPVALGSVFLNRYDVWPSLLTIVAIAALLVGREVAGFVLLAMGALTKVYPAVVVPTAAVWTRRRGRALTAFIATVVLVSLPFAALGPGGFSFSLYIQVTRHLETESLFGSLLLVADRIGVYDADIRTGKPGSLDMFGTLPSVLAAISLVAVVAAIAWTAWSVRRGDGDSLVTAAAAAVAAYIAFGKVLSPQYLVWLVPLVVLVRPLAAPALMLVALVLTQLEIDVWFDQVRTVGPVVWLLLARNLVVVTLALLLLAQLRGANQTSNPPPLASR
jgi:Glycosyltransferase family 87